MATFQRRLLAATCKTKENICVTLKRARTGASIFTEPSLENKVFVAVAIDFVPLSGRDSTICLRVTPINIILGNLLLHRLVPYLSLGDGRGGEDRDLARNLAKSKIARSEERWLGKRGKVGNLGRGNLSPGRIFSSLSNLGAKVTSLGDVAVS